MGIMDMRTFSEQTLAYLHASGWRPERQIDITHYQELYALHDLPALSSALDFLKQFGDLSIYFPHPRASQVKTGFEFKPDKTIWLRGLTTVRIYGELLGDDLSVIGSQIDDITLLMDRNGKMYGGFELLLLAVGNDPMDGIENLCAARTFPILINGNDIEG